MFSHGSIQQLCYPIPVGTKRPRSPHTQDAYTSEVFLGTAGVCMCGNLVYRLSTIACVGRI